MVMLFIILCAVAVVGWMKLSRELPLRRRYLENAKVYGIAVKSNAMSIRFDLDNACACLWYAMEGRSVRTLVLSDGVCGMVAGSGWHHEAIFLGSSSSDTASSVITLEGEIPRLRWVAEACWWIAAAFRHARHMMWWESMKRKYERAAVNPLKPLPLDPP